MAAEEKAETLGAAGLCTPASAAPVPAPNADHSVDVVVVVCACWGVWVPPATSAWLAAASFAWVPGTLAGFVKDDC